MNALRLIRTFPAFRGACRQSSTARTSKEVEEIAHSVGVRLTPNELASLQRKLSSNGFNTKADIEEIGKKALTERTTRDICLSVVCSVENPLDKWGVRIINLFDYTGTALFAVVGTQVAGDCGMNLIGCGLVGCVAALGGGSLNAMLYGGASPLLGQPGVRWVANPSYLIVALVASTLTFFGWPYYCQYQAEHYLENVIGNDKLNEDGGVDQHVFVETWEKDESFRKTIREALPQLSGENKVMTSRSREMHTESASGNDDCLVYFNHLDSDSSGDLDLQELKKLIQHRFYNGWETYTLDTLGLSSLSIAAVSMAIRLGLHPLISASSGVTVCFGGILRDLLCGRDLAIGSQSYAFATGSSSATYMALRELAVRRILVLPMAVRAFVSAGVCVALRGWEYYRGEPLLRPMHEIPEHPTHHSITSQHPVMETLATSNRRQT